MKNLNVYLKKKLVSYCVIFETKNVFIEMVICLTVGCESDTRKGKE